MHVQDGAVQVVRSKSAAHRRTTSKRCTSYNRANSTRVPPKASQNNAPIVRCTDGMRRLRTGPPRKVATIGAGSTQEEAAPTTPAAPGELVRLLTPVALLSPAPGLEGRRGGMLHHSASCDAIPAPWHTHTLKGSDFSSASRALLVLLCLP